MRTATVQSSGLKQLAADIVSKALKAGATDAEATIREGDEFSTTVRMGQVETLKESGSRGMGLRVLAASNNGYRVASTSTSDFSAEGIEHLVNGAIALASVTSEDPFAGLRRRQRIRPARRPKRGRPPALPRRRLLAAHRRTHRLRSASRSRGTGRRHSHHQQRRRKLRRNHGTQNLRQLAWIRGRVPRLILLHLRQSHCARQKRRDAARLLVHVRALAQKLDTPESVGAEAARRTLRRLDARRVKTQQTPLIFAPEIARSLIGAIFDAASGDSIYRGASFFTGKLGEQVAAESVTVIDDGTIIGGFGTSPFDGEGLPSRRTVIVENGMLTNYLLNTYTARKLGMKSTGNASRGLAGNPGIGAGNLFLTAGSQTPEEILRDVPSGLYVTELMGPGVNMVTGDYSRGAVGLWIENGELTYPVQEITIAGNLKDMFRNITAIGNDLEFRGSVASPTLRIDGMTIAGE